MKASGWSLSVAIVTNNAYDSLTKELGSSYCSSQSSAASEVESFVQYTRNYSIPAEVIEIEATTTFLSKSDWYDVLPTGARAFKELQVSDQFSIVRSVIAPGGTMASSTGATVAGAGVTKGACVLGCEVRCGCGCVLVKTCGANDGDEAQTSGEMLQVSRTSQSGSSVTITIYDLANHTKIDFVTIRY
jgi:hypothetical protein